MRHVVLVLCIFGVACSGNQSSSSPIAPSASTGVTSPRPSSALPSAAVAGIRGGERNPEITFTKWISGFPAMAGLTGGDVPGTFAGTVLRRTAFDNGVIVQLEARYQVIDPVGGHSFVALIEGTQNLEARKAVLNGVVTEGWLAGAQVHVEFDVIQCQHPSPTGDIVTTTCFQGTIRIMNGSAE